MIVSCSVEMSSKLVDVEESYTHEKIDEESARFRLLLFCLHMAMRVGKGMEQVSKLHPILGHKRGRAE